MTPRWREVNPTWGTPENNYSGFDVIGKLVDSAYASLGGFFFDEEHLYQVGKYRATAWEILPITAFEYQKDGSWATL
jgi:hypothetical protein